MQLSKAAQQELVTLAGESGNALNPRAVVAWAREHTESALHRAFEWNDTKAADGYRLEQARAFIRLVVTVPAKAPQVVRAFVSLEGDRGSIGYRSLESVMSDEDLRAQLIDQFLSDMQRFEGRYRQIQELAGVFAAVDQVRGRRRASAQPAVAAA